MTTKEQRAARRAYYEAHREEINAKQRANYAQNREKHLALCRKWQAEHQDYVKAYRKAYALTHARKARRTAAKWRKDNHEYYMLYNRLYGNKRYALKKGDFKKAAALEKAMKELRESRKRANP